MEFGWPFNRGGNYLNAKGDELWGTGSSAYERQMNYFAKRTTEICAFWKAAWGADVSDLTCVMSSQAASLWESGSGYIDGLTRTLLDCPLWAADAENTSGQNCASQVDAIAIAPYFGGYIGQSAYESQVVNWGLADVFNEINNGGLISSAFAGAPAESLSLSITNSSYHSPEALLSREMSATLQENPFPSFLPSSQRQ